MVFREYLTTIERMGKYFKRMAFPKGVHQKLRKWRRKVRIARIWRPGGVGVLLMNMKDDKKLSQSALNWETVFTTNLDRYYRMRLDPFFLETCGIDFQVLVVETDDTLELWDPKKWETVKNSFVLCVYVKDHVDNFGAVYRIVWKQNVPPQDKEAVLKFWKLQPTGQSKPEVNLYDPLTIFMVESINSHFLCFSYEKLKKVLRVLLGRMNSPTMSSFGLDLSIPQFFRIERKNDLIGLLFGEKSYLDRSLIMADCVFMPSTGEYKVDWDQRRFNEENLDFPWYGYIFRYRYSRRKKQRWVGCAFQKVQKGIFKFRARF